MHRFLGCECAVLMNLFISIENWKIEVKNGFAILFIEYKILFMSTKEGKIRDKHCEIYLNS